MALRDKAKNGKTNRMIKLTSRFNKPVQIQTIARSSRRLEKSHYLVRKSLRRKVIDTNILRSFEKDELVFNELVSSKVSVVLHSLRFALFVSFHRATTEYL